MPFLYIKERKHPEEKEEDLDDNKSDAISDGHVHPDS